MSRSRLRSTAALGLVVGVACGMAGTFVSSASVRGALWGVDGVALVVAAALLTVHHLRRGHEVAAAGFLVFALGQSLILGGAAMTPANASPSFGAGCGLWAAGLAIVSASGVMPGPVRLLGFAAAFLFAGVASLIFGGLFLTALSRPLPFFAFPFLSAALLGWAWVTLREP